MVQDAGLTTTVRRSVAAGTVSGLIAGVITAYLLGLKDGLTPGWFDLDYPKYGAAWQVVFSVIVGAGFGAMFRRYRNAYAAAISGGVLAGLVGWIILPLSFVPFASGVAVDWSLLAVSATFAPLIALLLAGGLVGLVSYVGLIVWHRRRSPSPQPPPKEKRHIVVLGGGFGGVATAQQLEKRFLSHPEVELTLISDSNFLLFTPMLAEVASSSLQASNVSAPVRAAVPRTRVMRASVESIDLERRSVTAALGGDAGVREVPFDDLVLGVGAVPRFFDDSVAEHSFTLKTLRDASVLRSHVLAQLERSEYEPDPRIRSELLTFVVCGGGFAGTEMIAELFDLVHSVGRLYPRLDRDRLRFILVHSRDRILPELPEGLAHYSQRKLEDRGIEFLLSTRVASATAASVSMTDNTTVPTRTLIWTAGNQPNPLLRDLGVELDGGAVRCNADMSVKGAPGLWAVGDCARIPDPSSEASFYPPTAQHAIRQGKVLGDNIHSAYVGRQTKPFRFKTIGILVALGHRTAAAEVYGRKFSGLLAWFMWRSIYLGKLPGLEKKTRVAFDWALDIFFPRDIVLEDPPMGDQRMAGGGPGDS